MYQQTKPRSYKDLVVWQKGIELAKAIYRLTNKFPTEEKFGLVSQMRRAAISAPSNIAEGQSRNTTSQFIHFISNVEGSIAELETQLIIAVELGFCKRTEVQDVFDLIEEEQRMLNALRRSLENKY